jgi:diguanylate cyclase (GGDEF)-like protein
MKAADESWIYEGLERLAALGCLARAILVRAECSAWLFIGAAVLATTRLDLARPLFVLLISLAAWQLTGRARRVQLQDRAMLGMPIVCGIPATGVLIFASQWPVPVSAIVLASATIVLVLARTALSFRENARLLEASRQEALTDSLTGLANRRKLLADLEATIQVAREGGSRMLVLFDLNGFKSYNDSFGHPAGDALLSRLAAKLAAAAAPDGNAYRLGGDEFCVLLPEPDPDLDLMARALWESGEGFDVTSAYGVALIPSDATTVSTALSVADERLYAHKERLAEIAAAPGKGPPRRSRAAAAPERRRAGIAPGPSRVFRPLSPRRRKRARRRARAGAAQERRSRAAGRAPASGRAPCRSSRARRARSRSRNEAR